MRQVKPQKEPPGSLFLPRGSRGADIPGSPSPAASQRENRESQGVLLPLPPLHALTFSLPLLLLGCFSRVCAILLFSCLPAVFKRGGVSFGVGTRWLEKLKGPFCVPSPQVTTCPWAAGVKAPETFPAGCWRGAKLRSSLTSPSLFRLSSLSHCAPHLRFSAPGAAALHRVVCQSHASVPPRSLEGPLLPFETSPVLPDPLRAPVLPIPTLQAPRGPGCKAGQRRDEH